MFKSTFLSKSYICHRCVCTSIWIMWFHCLYGGCGSGNTNLGSGGYLCAPAAHIPKDMLWWFSILYLRTIDDTNISNINFNGQGKALQFKVLPFRRCMQCVIDCSDGYWHTVWHTVVCSDGHQILPYVDDCPLHTRWSPHALQHVMVHSYSIVPS